MIVRPYYMELLKTYRDVPLVKILSGIRRCGKSTILDMLRDDLIKNSVPAGHIICMRYTPEDFDGGMTDKDMYNGINEKMTDDDRYYLLLNEVQEIAGWEKAVNSLLESANTDIYVTGSNSKLMSSEISTYLTGRYISIPVFTLSFAEYMEFKKSSERTPKELLAEYIRMVDFPVVALSNFDVSAAYQIVEGIYNSVITSDITRRHNITNFDLSNRVVKYIIENVGKNETKEIDFVAVRRDERIYVQVCRNLPEESDREVANLLEIKDHYPKYVVTLDELAAGNINGIKIIHLVEFLLRSDY